MKPVKENYKNSNIIVNTKYNFVYTKIPKAGCSSIVYSIMPTFNLDIEIQNIHGDLSANDYTKNNLIFLERCDDYKFVRTVLYSNSYFKFTCFRNPLDRFISGFYEKIVYTDNKPKVDFCLDFIEMIKKGTPTETVFCDFLDYLTTLSNYNTDPHFRLQTDLALTDYIKYDKMFMLENIQRDYECVISKFPEIKRITVENPGIYDNDKQMLIKKYQDKIRKLYEKDYDFLNSNNLLDISRCGVRPTHIIPGLK